MKLIDTSVKRPIGVIITVLIVLLIGAVSLNGIAVDLLPDIEIPVAVVATSYSGGAPEEVMNLVTKPLEGVLSTLEGLDTIESTSSTGQSVIIMLFKYGTNLDAALMDIRDKVDQGKMMLPDDASDPMVIKFDPNAQPIVQLSLSGNMDLEQLTQLAEDIVQPQLERVAGVAQISISGDRSREIRIEANPSKLDGYGLSINDIVQTIAINNSSVSAGNIIRGSQDLNVRLVGEYANIKDIENVLIRTATGQMVKLSELATIKDSFKEQTSYSFVNGEQALSLNVSKQSDANTVQVAENVLKQVERLSKELPVGANLVVVMDTSEFIKTAISNVVDSLLLGSFFATIVLFLFLKNFRSTLIILLSIPISLIATFMLMYFSGETINILTMSGLALGVGMLLDGSIVILENIFRHRQMGYGKIEAAIAGSKEVIAAVVASGLTTIAAFVPIIFTDGLVAELFRPLALVVTFSLAASLVVSITVVPMLSSRLMRVVDIEKISGIGKKRNRLTGAIGDTVSEIYPKLLKWAVNHKKTIVIGSFALIIGSLALLPFVNMEFMPAMDQGEINVTVTLPNGTNLEETHDIVSEIENFILQMPDINMVASVVGSGGMMDTTSSTNKATMYVRLVPLADRVKPTNETIKEIEQFGLQFPDLKINLDSMQSGGLTGAPIIVKVTGRDSEVLKALAEEVEMLIASVGGLTNVNNSLSATRPELHIEINNEVASEYGLTSSQIMQVVRTGFNGQTATKMKTDGQEIDLFVTLPDDYRKNLTNLKNMRIMSPLGIPVSLDSLAEFKVVEGPNAIVRENMEQGATVTANLLDRDLQSAVTEVNQLISQIHVPEGYEVTLGGQNEDLTEAMVSLGIALVLAIFLIYAVMAIQFESLLHPFVIMFSLPTMIVGVIAGLLITGQTLSVFGMIGIVMLAGIVVSNAILFVDYTNTLRSRGTERMEAVLQAGRHRLRPIMMTTLTTVLAMVPISMGLGEGTEMQQSLGTVIVFGLSFSTLVTLVLVPVMYLYMDSANAWFRKKLLRNKQEQILSEDAAETI